MPTNRRCLHCQDLILACEPDYDGECRLCSGEDSFLRPPAISRDNARRHAERVEARKALRAEAA